MYSTKKNSNPIDRKFLCHHGLQRVYEKSINVKNKLYKQYLLCPTEGNSVEFKSYRNKLNNLIRKCKREYYHKKKLKIQKLTSDKHGKQ